MRSPVLVALSLLAACAASTSTEPTPPPAPSAPPRAVPSASVAAAPPAPPPPRAPEACFPPALLDAEMFTTSLQGDRLTVCLRNDEGSDPSHPCLDLDLTTRVISRASAMRGDHPAPAAPRKDDPLLPGDARSVSVCTQPGKAPEKKCPVIRPAGKLISAGHGDSASDALIAAQSPDRNVVAILLPQQPRKDELKVNVGTYDARTLQPRATFRVPEPSDPSGIFGDRSDLWTLRWLGNEHLHLSAHRCCGPAGSEALLDLRKGGTFEPLGDPALFQPIRDDIWLRGNAERGATEDASFVELTFMHLGNGQRTKLRLPARPSREPEGHELAAHPWKRPSWIIVHTNPPGVVWLDVEQEAIVAQQRFPLCP